MDTIRRLRRSFLLLLPAAFLVAPVHAWVEGNPDQYQNPAVRKVYCFDGSSNNTQWAWQIEDAFVDECNDLNTGPVAPIDEVTDEREFAFVFRDSINTACTPANAPVLQPQALVLPANLVALNCPDPGFTAAILVEARRDFDLGVAPAGVFSSNTPCTGPPDNDGVVDSLSTGGSCNFNPEIARGEADLPAVHDWGRVVLIGLLLAASAWMLARRARSRASGVSDGAT